MALLPTLCACGNVDCGSFQEEFKSIHKTTTLEFFRNYQQHKVGIWANYFFHFISIVQFIIVTHKSAGKYYLIFLLYIKRTYMLVNISTMKYNFN